jgi:hypothetical protein
MRSFRYYSGEEVRKGDRITYHGESGEVEFLVTDKTGDATMDWYIENSPEGGFMIRANNFGNVFLTDSETDEDLLFVARASI